MCDCPSVRCRHPNDERPFPFWQVYALPSASESATVNLTKKRQRKGGQDTPAPLESMDMEIIHTRVRKGPAHPISAGFNDAATELIIAGDTWFESLSTADWTSLRRCDVGRVVLHPIDTTSCPFGYPQIFAVHQNSGTNTAEMCRAPGAREESHKDASGMLSAKGVAQRALERARQGEKGERKGEGGSKKWGASGRLKGGSIRGGMHVLTSSDSSDHGGSDTGDSDSASGSEGRRSKGRGPMAGFKGKERKGPAPRVRAKMGARFTWVDSDGEVVGVVRLA